MNQHLGLLGINNKQEKEKNPQELALKVAWNQH